MWIQRYHQKLTVADPPSQASKIIVGYEGSDLQWGGKFVFMLLRQAYPGAILEQKNVGHCDFIVRSSTPGGVPRWNTESKKYILWSCENYDVDVPENASDVLHAPARDRPGIYIPFFMFSPHLHLPRLNTAVARPYLVAYCASNCYGGGGLREHLFNEFVQQAGSDTCHALGKCHGKYPETLHKLDGFWCGKELPEAYSKYKFAFALENSDHPGYITEKIVNVFHSGAIPIYWGTDYVTRFFNEKAFVNLKDFKSPRDCVEFVCNMDDSTREAMLREPIYKDCDMVHLFDEKRPNALRDSYVKTLRDFLQLDVRSASFKNQS